MNFYTFLPKLLNMSLTASVAIVCVLLLRLFLKKAPKVISYTLWAVVLFRLLCPVSIASGFSLFGLMNVPTDDTSNRTSSIAYVPENIVHTEFTAVTLPVPGVSNAINNTLPQGEEQLVADSLEAPIVIGTYIWLVGVLVMAVYSVASYFRLRDRLLIASPLWDNIYLADEITTPFVMGLIRPKIYLPSDTQERQQSYIILHEKHHIRRGDHIMKVLAFLALSIHWFNPLVWVAFVYAGKDMEMSCDEAVVKKLGDDILADYTASLLSLAIGKTIIAGVPLAFGEGDTGGRIRNLAHWKKPTLWVVLVAVIACVALGIGLLTNPEKEDTSDKDGYYLVIGEEGVKTIEVTGPNSSGGVENADGSAFRVGEKIWLEQLQGVTDLRGISIVVLGEKGKILHLFSVPKEATEEQIADKLNTDTWLLVPSTFETTINNAEKMPVVAKWTYSPMMSATVHYAFHFVFDVDHYSHIEASCDNGMLWNPHAQGQPREKGLRFEQGEPLCWEPDIEGKWLRKTAKSAKITFTMFDGEAVVSKGVLDIVRTGKENGQSFYEAQLTDTDVLTLLQEEGRFAAYIVRANKDQPKEEELGMISETVSVTGTPLAMAKEVVSKQFAQMEESGYINWRIDSLTEEYYYETSIEFLNDRAVTVYRLEYSFLVKNPENSKLDENSIIDEDGWVSAKSPNTYLCVVKDGGALSYIMLTVNDCAPGDEAFTEELKRMLGVGPETAEGYYSVATSASAKEVEQFAFGIKEDVLLKDWESLSVKLAYPIQIGGKSVKSSEEFLAMDIDGKLNQAFVDGIAAESCREMFCNYQGIMMGATGQIWIAGVDNGSGQWELKVIALNGLILQPE